MFLISIFASRDYKMLAEPTPNLIHYLVNKTILGYNKKQMSYYTKAVAKKKTTTT